MSFDEHSAPIKTRDLCARKRKRKKYSQKEFPENVVAGRFVVSNRRAARQAPLVARLVSRLQLVPTTKHMSCHLLLLICMSFDEQSAPIDTRSLCARKRKRKKYSQKEFPENVVAGRFVVSNRRAARQAQIVVRLASWLQHAHTTKHQVLPCALGDLHVLRRSIHTTRNAFSRKTNLLKKNFPRLLLLAGIVVCDRRAARQAQIVEKLASPLHLDHTTRHKSSTCFF
jgi:hypothetical protein